MRRIGKLASSVWSGSGDELQDGRPPELMSHQRSPKADSLRANVTPMKSKGGLLASQCDTEEVLGGARKRLGAVGEPGEEVLQPAGGSMRCSCLTWTPRSFWNGAMSTHQSICAKEINRFLIQAQITILGFVQFNKYQSYTG